MKIRLFLFALAALSASAIAQDKTGQLAGMSQEIAVKPAKDLGVTAPEGANVAVLDQSWVAEDAAASQIQDHHNAHLRIGNTPPVWPIKVKGKLFVPENVKTMPSSLRISARRQTPQGLKLFSEASIATEETGKWIDFEVELPEKNAEEGESGVFLLMLSAVPLAGPIYLDGLHVTDASGNELWELPSFEE